MKDNIYFSILRPSGNDTAIVDTNVPRKAQPGIAAMIQQNWQSVEQVLFVERHNGGIHAQMAGGEFCINAARALGFYLQEGRHGSATFSMSGIDSDLTVGISKRSASLKMPVETGVKISETDFSGITRVDLPGIAHFIITPQSPIYQAMISLTVEQQKKIAHDWIQKFAKPDDLAVGMIFVEWNGRESARILPFVWVRAIDTLYAETACGSGALAACLNDAKSNPENKRYQIMQPSGMFLGIEILKNSTQGGMAVISGLVQLVGKYELPKAVAQKIRDESWDNFRASA